MPIDSVASQLQTGNMGGRKTMEASIGWRILSRASCLTAVTAFAALALGYSATVVRADALEITSLVTPGLNENQTLSITAADRPYELISSFTLNEAKGSIGVGPAENLKDAQFDLPPGIVGNAAAFPTCSQRLLDRNGCPIDAQVGFADSSLQLGEGRGSFPAPVFNMEPPPGVAAQFAFRVQAANARINFHVRTGRDYGVRAILHNLNESAPIYGSTVSIWGVPAESSHDAERGGAYPKPEVLPLLSNPTFCHEPLFTRMEATTWQHPGTTVFATPYEAPSMTGCDKVDFAPAVDAQPTTNLGDSPSGLDFHLEIPQSQDPAGSATAHLRESVVELPPSLTVNASSANGLQTCHLSQVGYTGVSNEEQTLIYNPRSIATFTIRRGNVATEPIAAKAGHDEVIQAIESLPGLAGNVGLDGGPGAWVVSFGGALAGSDVPELAGTAIPNSVQTLVVSGTAGGFNMHLGAATAGSTFRATFGAAESRISVSNLSRPLKVGDLVEGPGIAAGAKVTGFFFGSPTLPELSIPTTQAETDVQLTTELLFDASAAEIQTSLQEIPALGEGNVLVTATGASAGARSFQVLFTGVLAGSQPPLLTASNSLTPPGSGVAITQLPSTPQPLEVPTTYESGTPQFTPGPANCPGASKLGRVKISSPVVIDHPLEGNVYLATPQQNPFGSLLAMYITVNDPKSGVVVKLPGLIEANPKTGQLTATVSEAPQLPFEDLDLEFFKGNLAPLKTGIACGTSIVTTDLVPWSSPEGATMHPDSSFTIAKGAGGGACVSSEAQAPNTPSFSAGTFDPEAGAYSPFTLKLARADGTQQLTGIDTTLPKGLIAKLAGVPYCSDAALASATSKLGKAELASPSCPAASKVGTVTVGAGAGPTPLYTGGKAYLAGPYKGAPLSLAVITPAVAGPFDLGTVVIRNALYVNPETAVVHAVSDPFPSILQGIPLDLRSVVLNLDKPSFTKNPTNCSPFAITGAATALTGQSAPLNQRFQVGSCNKLKFAPKLALSLKGGTARSDHPALKAVLTAKPNESGIARTVVALPHSEFLAQNHIKTICTRVQFAAGAGNGAECPKGSIYGKASATTPLLDQPLSGPVYLRSSSNPLPDLVAALSGQIDVNLVGRIDSKDGGIRTTFDSVPDAPVAKFVLSMQGGKKGLLENSRNLCRSVNRAIVQMDGQSGKTFDTKPLLGNGCKKAKKGVKRSGQR